MRPRVFFDTNIILDLIQERPGYDVAARIVFGVGPIGYLF